MATTCPANPSCAVIATTLNSLQLQLNTYGAAVNMTVGSQAQNSNDFFLIVMGAFVYLMQPGFAFLECGLIRQQHVANTLFRNVLCSALSAVAYWMFGYALAFGDQSNQFIGYDNFLLFNVSPTLYSFWFFEWTFAAVATSIVSGAIAERCSVLAYFAYGILVPGVIYAIVTHWTWDANGLLLNLNIYGQTGAFQDFAGSGGVHVCGATCALAGAICIGSRRHRYKRPEQQLTPEELDIGHPLATHYSYHSAPLVLIGVFFLLFGFVGFNCGSLLHITQVNDGPTIANIAINTFVAAGCGATTAMLTARIFHRRWSLMYTANGAIAGMVALCSGCNVMYNWSAAVVGSIAGINFIIWAAIIHLLRIDDPVETVALHLGSGIWGCISTALFDPTHGVVFYFNSASFWALAVQCLGLALIIGFSFVCCFVLFGFLRLAGLLRVPRNWETKGLDNSINKEQIYPFLDHKHLHGYGGISDVAHRHYD